MSPPLEGTSAAAETSALTLSIIKDQAVGSFSTVFSVAGPYFLGLAVLLVLAAVAWFVRRAAAEARHGRRCLDPRPLVDPFASDVLGEW